MSNARHRKRTSRLKPTAAAVAVASASCGGLSLAVLPASAQTSSSQTSLPEVRVTAQPEHSAVSSPKATAPLRDTPQTVSVIPESVFTQQGARTLTEVLRNTPGITFSAGENGFSTNNNNFGLRGFDSSSSVFVDGVRDSGNYARDAFNIEQVEVVKGSSADLGRGGPGGYVNLVTKSPKRENFTNGSVSYGFDSSDAKNRWRAALDANRTFSDSVAGRLNLLLQDGGVAGREHAKQRSVGIAPSLSFGMGTPTRVDLAYQHVRQDDRPDWGVPAAMLPGTMRHDPSFRPGRDTYYGLLSDFDDTRADTFTARVEHRLSTDTTITNLTRWSRTRRDAVYTIPFSYDPATVTVTTQRQAFDRDNGVLANQTNLSTRFAAAGLQHRLSAGVELSRETSDARRFGTQNNPGTGSPISGYDPDPSRAGPWSDLAATQTAEVEVKTVAAYVYDTVELSPRWQLTGGVRLEHYSVDISSRNVDGTPLGQDGYDASKTSLNGRLGLVYKPAAHASIYASIGQSTQPPGSYLSNSDISRTGDNAFPGWDGPNHADAKVQKSVNFELGAKWDHFGGRLSTSAAIFRTERRNVAWTGRNTTAGGADDPVVIQGYGKQIVQGLELGVAGSVTPNWQLYGGLTFLDSKRRHSAFLDQQRRNANAGDYGSHTSTDGDRLSFTPEFAANLWTAYRFGSGFTLGGGMQHVGSVYAGRPDDAERVIPNGQFGKLPSYTVVNLMLAYDFDRNTTLRLNIDNIGDKLYASSANWPAQRVFLGPPRTVMLSADFRF